MQTRLKLAESKYFKMAIERLPAVGSPDGRGKCSIAMSQYKRMLMINVEKCNTGSAFKVTQ